MHYSKSFYIIVFIFFNFFCFAQNNTLDSLKLELKNAKHDTIKFKTLSNLVEANDKNLNWKYTSMI
jgi:hypothetical protein